MTINIEKINQQIDAMDAICAKGRAQVRNLLEVLLSEVTGSAVKLNVSNIKPTDLKYGDVYVTTKHDEETKRVYVIRDSSNKYQLGGWCNNPFDAIRIHRVSDCPELSTDAHNAAVAEYLTDNGYQKVGKAELK